MAGYIGSKAVALSTTGAEIKGDSNVTGALTVGGAFTSKGIDDNATSTAITINASEQVLIGTTANPSSSLMRQVLAGNGAYSQWSRNTTTIAGGYLGTDGNGLVFGEHTGAIGAETYTERMRIDASGNVLMGKTSASGSNVVGFELNAANYLIATRDGGASIVANRKTSDGDVAVFQKNGVSVGSISVSATGAAIYLGGTAAANKLDDYEEGTWTPVIGSGTMIAAAGVNVYTKVGREVTLHGAVSNFSDITSSNTVALSGLPFTASGVGTGAIFLQRSNKVVTSSYVNVGGTQITFYGPYTAGFAPLIHADFNNTSATIYYSLTYTTLA
jgi:hypothetical protein